VPQQGMHGARSFTTTPATNELVITAADMATLERKAHGFDEVAEVNRVAYEQGRMRGVRDDAMRWCLAAGITAEDVELRHSRHECYYCGDSVRKDGLIMHTFWQCPQRQDKDEEVTRLLRLEDRQKGAAAERASQQGIPDRRQGNVARETDQDQTFSRRPPRDRSSDPWGSRDPSQERSGRSQDAPGSPGHDPRDVSPRRIAWEDREPRGVLRNQAPVGWRPYPYERQGRPTGQGRGPGDRPPERWPSRSRSRDPPAEEDRRTYSSSRADRFAQDSQRVPDPPATRPVPGRGSDPSAMARQSKFAGAVANTMTVDDSWDRYASQGHSCDSDSDALDDSNALEDPYSENGY
jgi:hypothetical protein